MVDFPRSLISAAELFDVSEYISVQLYLRRYMLLCIVPSRLVLLTIQALG